jgi:SAM-dependent methyltransferase
MTINKIIFNSNNTNTDLCKLGSLFQSDKSPYNSGQWRHGYTPFYDILFSSMRYKEINIGEIGILKNASIQMWRMYFSNANIYAWDSNPDLLEYARGQNLENVYYDQMDASSEDSIKECFDKTGVKFDIIIDDASHQFWDQIKVIRTAYNYLNPGGYLIIEDIDSSKDEFQYYQEISAYNHTMYFSNMSFIETDHNNKMTYPFDNDKLLVLIRNKIEKN